MMNERRMTISIAMTTYNGERYLQDQLSSFLDQTRAPDEIVVCDDGSTDRTLDILESFSQSAPFAVRVHRNPKNLGYAANFGQAIERCRGDLIFISDQDDVWFEAKLEKIEQVFAQNASAWVVINDAKITVENLRPTGLTIAGRLHSAGFAHDRVIFGSCTSFRAVLKPVLLPIPAAATSHDDWLHALALMLGCRRLVLEPLQYYRRHEGNTSNWSGGLTVPVPLWRMARRALNKANLDHDPVVVREQRLTVLELLRQRLESHAGELKTLLPSGLSVGQAFARLDREVKANEKRCRLLKQGKLRRFFAALSLYYTGDYRYFNGWRSLARDILW